MDGYIGELRLTEARLAEALSLLSRAKDAILAAQEDDDVAGYENEHGEMVYFGDLVAEIDEATGHGGLNASDL